MITLLIDLDRYSNETVAKDGYVKDSIFELAEGIVNEYARYVTKPNIKIISTGVGIALYDILVTKIPCTLLLVNLRRLNGVDIHIFKGDII
jgi:hypothetical protein